MYLITAVEKMDQSSNLNSLVTATLCLNAKEPSPSPPVLTSLLGLPLGNPSLPDLCKMLATSARRRHENLESLTFNGEQMWVPN